MYEMYPDRWTQSNDGPQSVVERPHRRARKDHRVDPQIIIELELRRHPAK